MRSSSGPRGAQHLFALHALQGVLLLIAGHTEVLVLLGYEALGSNGLLAALAGEAGLMPAVALVFHLAGPCGGRQQKAAEGVRLAWGPSDVPPEPATTEFHDTASLSCSQRLASNWRKFLVCLQMQCFTCDSGTGWVLSRHLRVTLDTVVGNVK